MESNLEGFIIAHLDLQMTQVLQDELIAIFPFYSI